jgi:AcrR family transcriptional regulator
MEEAPHGLRERNRLTTMKQLHAAAKQLALDEGIAAATVEAITERAGVSKRTFFNYYASKEDAILGTFAPTVPEAALTRYFDDDSTDSFTRTVHLIVAIIRSSIPDQAGFDDRRVLIARFPELRTRLSQHVAAAERLIEATLEERLAALTDDAAPVRAADSTRVLLMLAGTVLRYVYTRDPDSISAEDDDDAVIDAAIATFRKVLDEIL